MSSSSKPKKILYAASTASHLKIFHTPYIEELRKKHTVLTMANGDGVDLPIVFDKRFFSFANLRSLFRIRKILKHEHFDVLILHTSLAAFLIRAAMLGWKKRPFVLNVVHGYLFPKESGGRRDRLLLWCERLMRKKTDEIAVMNREDLQIAREYKLCLGRIFFIHGMGITIPEGIPTRDESIRQRFSVDPNAFLCCFVGELSKRKNQSFLISSAARLRKEGIPVHLLLIGEGGTRTELEAEIARRGLCDHVTLCGSTNEVRAYLSAVDLYVSASVSEGLPFNVMEAMSCGLPIVASDIKGQNDLLKNTESELYPFNDSDAFCTAVRKIYESGAFGVGSVAYPQIDQYRLHAVFEENLKELTEGWAEK